MALPHWMERTLLKSVDAVMATIPQRVPPKAKLRTCRLIAHRGSHDQGASVCENTLAAFERAVQGGAAGIEFDIRWTKDLEPVIFHDETCLRVFGVATEIASLTFRELRERHPLIPHFKEVLEHFGRRTHLMIELKRLPLSAPSRILSSVQLEKISEALRDLSPSQDYHFMSLQMELLEQAVAKALAPKSAIFSIAEVNVGRVSEKTLREGWAGFTGQYILVSQERIRLHQEAGQQVGTGFADSENVLYREIGRGVDWVFTNRAPDMSQALKERLSES